MTRVSTHTGSSAINSSLARNGAARPFLSKSALARTSVTDFCLAHLMAIFSPPLAPVVANAMSGHCDSAQFRASKMRLASSAVSACGAARKATIVAPGLTAACLRALLARIASRASIWAAVVREARTVPFQGLQTSPVAVV